MLPPRIRLGRAVRDLRDAAGFSQEAFAAHIGVHRTSMSSIELGKLNVGLDTLEQLAHGLGMPAWGLLRIAEAGVGVRRALRDGGASSAGRSAADARRKVAEDQDS
jgi:transcriptional regulator with XRE-family HTH domain